MVGGGSNPTFGSSDELFIDDFDSNKAILSTSLGTTSKDIRLGSAGAETGELLISGGTNSLANTFRVGRGGSTGLLEVTGGTLSVLNSYSTFGDGGDATVTMSGGTLNFDRSTWAQKPDDNTTLNMTGGTINITASDPTPSTSSSGSFRTAEGNATLNIGGTAVVNADVLIMVGNTTGNSVITLSGGELNLTGSNLDFLSGGTIPDIPTLQFADNAEFKMEGGIWTLDGDMQTALNGAMNAGYITHSAGNEFINITYAAGPDLTTVTIQDPANGDFDGDGDVDGSDFLAWQAGFGIESGASLAEGDANGDGAVNADDFTIWQNQYGTTSGAGSLTSGAVPEPASLGLCLIALVGMGGLLIRRSRV